MNCERCGLAPHSEAHEAWHVQNHRASSSDTFTCDKCFAEVRFDSRAAHRWWHVGLAEIAAVLERRSSEPSG